MKTHLRRIRFKQIAKPWPRAGQIMSNVLLTLMLFISFDHFLGTFATEANPNNMFGQLFGNKCNGHQFEQHFELELLFLV